MRWRRKLTPAKLLAALAALAAVSLAIIVIAKGNGDDPLIVDVFARQYSWSFGYPDQGNAFSAGELHVPLGRQIEFPMHSQDVVHAFWVPEWQIKEDVSAGTISTATVSPTRAGTYQLICAQRCGIEHASMRAKVVVESPADFDEWVSSLDRTIPPPLQDLIRVDTDLESISRDPGPRR
jgi:cytochrome c oxidase subunit 2